MNYKFEIEIQLEQNKIFDLALDRFTLLLWQSGYSDVELISGTPGEEGVKYKLTMGRKNKKVAVIETITTINRPYEYKAEYSLEEISFFSKNQFLRINQNSTKLITETEMKFPVAFFNFFLWLTAIPAKWQLKKALRRFKKFAEGYDPINKDQLNSA